MTVMSQCHGVKKKGRGKKVKNMWCNTFSPARYLCLFVRKISAISSMGMANCYLLGVFPRKIIENRNGLRANSRVRREPALETNFFRR